MKHTTLFSTLALAALLSPSVHAETAYAINGRQLLVRFDTNTPAFTDDSKIIRGLQPGESILGIDFRPANGTLYGLGSHNRLYTIDVSTGIASPVGSAPFATPLQGTEFGFDFNPTVDRIRVVSNTGQNLRLHPDTGAVAAVDGPLNSDSMAPYRIVGAAYTNSVAGATTTVLYGIDAELRALVTQNPPNDGKLNPVGMMNIDMSEVAGFDISPRSGVAFVVARVRGSAMAALWEVNLSTGATMQLGTFDRLDQVGALAIPGR
ncbi:MAG: DUF4394 domain-containing protein [Bryobacterales bacterium]|nr:DUF4394 domain-containing protein [Bryobacterales bacterium]